MNCQDCDRPADVLTNGAAFCARHYMERVAQLGLNANRLQLGADGIFRKPSETEAEERKRQDQRLMQQRASERNRRREGVDGLKRALEE